MAYAKSVVVLVDDFGYTSVNRANTLFYDYYADYESGWYDYRLDSLAELDQLQSVYYAGFGAYKYLDDNGSDLYHSYISDGITYATDWQVDDFDDDPIYDYMWWHFDTASNDWLPYYANDLDDLHEIPNLPEAEALGMLLPHFRSYEDLDGAVDYYDPFDQDLYDKIDADPEFDYVFYDWQIDIDPVTGSEGFEYVDAAAIAQRQLDGLWPTYTPHGDVVLDSFLETLNPAYADDVSFVLIDAWDEEENGYGWHTGFLFDNVNTLLQQLATTEQITSADIDVVSLSFGSANTSTNESMQALTELTTVIQAMPNSGKYANRYWDTYLQDTTLLKPDVVKVTGLVEDIDGNNELSDYELSLEGWADSVPYGNIAASAHNSNYQWNGNSFAAPKVAASLLNLQLDMAAIGIAESAYNKDQGVALISDSNKQLDYTSYADLPVERLLEVFADIDQNLQIDASYQTSGLNLAGGSGTDSIVGSQYDDNIFAGAGNDLLIGGASDIASNGYNLLDGGGGMDLVSYANLDSGYSVAVDLFHQSSEQDTTFDGQQQLQASDHIVDVEGVIGTQGADTIAGNGYNNDMTGEAGDDRINGGRGNDVLDGGIGDDTLHGGMGNDSIWGGIGSDILTGGLGADSFYYATEDLLDISDNQSRDQIDDFCVWSDHISIEEADLSLAKLWLDSQGQLIYDPSGDTQLEAFALYDAGGDDLLLAQLNNYTDSTMQDFSAYLEAIDVV